MAKSSESGAWDQDPSGSGRAGSTFVKRRPNLGRAAKAKVVRDDWDDDEEEEERERDVDGDGERGWDGNAKASETKNDGTAPDPRSLEERRGEEDSSKIWEEANKRAPMPELIVASASTSQSLAPLPPAALQPTLRILKRPSPNASANNVGVASSAPLTSSSPGPTSGSSSGVTSPAPRGTLAQREAQYQEARSRIFGGHASSGSMSRTSSSSGGVVIVRDPFGPVSEPELDPGVGGQDKADDPGRPAKGFGERRRGRK